MDLNLKALARLGAQVRLAELVAEIDALIKQFPGVAGEKLTTRAAAAPERRIKKARKRRRMPAAQRKAMSERMKKYWAERKKPKK
jgi:hypothetical protein